MFDNQLAKEILGQILYSIGTVFTRFQQIKEVSEFTNSPAGMEKLDSICMQLIVIGEGLKNFDKVTENSILLNYPQVEWKKAMGLRDIITHHYADINAEAIYNVCKTKIPILFCNLKTRHLGTQSKTASLLWNRRKLKEVEDSLLMESQFKRWSTQDIRGEVM